MHKSKISNVITTTSLLAAVTAAAFYVEAQPMFQSRDTRMRNATASPRRARTIASDRGIAVAALPRRITIPKAWIYVPVGTCKKIAGGKLSPSR